MRHGMAHTRSHGIKIILEITEIISYRKHTFNIYEYVHCGIKGGKPTTTTKIEKEMIIYVYNVVCSLCV